MPASSSSYLGNAMHWVIFSLLFSPRLVFGGYGNPAPQSPSSTASSSSSTQTVTVGSNGALAYNPSIINAASGTFVEFHFMTSQHSVSQSSFSSPCAPIGDTAFFSGTINAASGQAATVFTLAINDTSPLWFYCSTLTHCQGGMNGVINPPSDNSQTLAQYNTAAAKTSNTVSPARVQGGTVGTPSKPAATSTPAGEATKKNEVGLVGFLALLVAWGLAL